MFHLAQGSDCYWAIGQHGVTRLPISVVTEGGHLIASEAERVRNAHLSPHVDPDLYHMTVVITTKCNLACSCCFQNNAPPDNRLGRAPARIPGAVLDDDAIAAILAFCRRQMSARGAHKLDLMLFGGEPTLHLDQCLRLLDGAHRLGLTNASMISNATRLGPDAAVTLERAGLRSVQVTFDGDAPVHDRIRITPGGHGTFGLIVRNLAQAASRTALRLLLRVNLTGESIRTADVLIDRLADRLIPQNFDISFARVNNSGPGFTDTLEPSPALARRIIELYLRALEAGFNVGIPTLKKCIACDEIGGATGSVVNADGTLYSCWESVGKKGYEVGTVSGGYAPDDIIRSRWVSCGFGATDGVGTPESDSFTDRISAAILDWLYSAGRLSQFRAPVPAVIPL